MTSVSIIILPSSTIKEKEAMPTKYHMDHLRVKVKPCDRAPKYVAYSLQNI